MGAPIVSSVREVIPTERIQRLIDPAFVASLDDRSLDDLRAMKAECNDVENALSYHRRLAQARIEILEAEHERRARGGTVEDLVKDLPRILSAESGRSSITDTRVPPPDAPGARAALARRPRGADRRHDAREPAGAPGRRVGVDARAPARLRARALRSPPRDARRDRHARAGDRGPAGRRDRGLMPESFDSLETRLHDLGGFIRDQRRNARLSLRKLSELAGISNPYLSQIERGLRKPSAEILQSIARGPAHLRGDALRPGRDPRRDARGRARRRRSGRGDRRRSHHQRPPEAGAGRDLPVVPGRERLPRRRSRLDPGARRRRPAGDRGPGRAVGYDPPRCPSAGSPCSRCTRRRSLSRAPATAAV